MNKEVLKAKTKKFVNYLKKHKKKLIIGTVLVGGTVAGFVVRKSIMKKRCRDLVGEYEIFYASNHTPVTNEDVMKTNWNVGSPIRIAERPLECAATVDREIVLNDLKVADIGKLGEEISSKLNGVTDNSSVSAILHVWEPKEK